ncbi:glycoside hydrolase family 6 protein [Pendulispora albinea]|uniref:glycoside hydrolase family 6 protein n=1 Tax=Pendulispora albinea TaxID=2741071 RepID=UPI00374E0BA8
MRMRTIVFAVIPFVVSAIGCGSTDTPSPGPAGGRENDPITEDQKSKPPSEPGDQSGSDPAELAAAAAPNGYYVDPNSNPATWVRDHGSDSRAATIRSNIASKPGARWFGNWNGNISTDVSSFVGAAATANKWPILVAYNIPGRDCNGASSGGAGSPAAYRTWISAFAAAIGSRPAIVVIEPDAVAQLDCMPNAGEKQTRLELLRYATEQLRDKAKNARAYLDGGNAKWIAAPEMATRLDSAGVRNVRGFAVNVSNFYTTDESLSYASNVNTSLSSKFAYTKKFVIDTSRNGKGSKNGEWCNPAERKLGTATQAGGGGAGSNADALLWVKVPGDSDGPCGTAPSTPAGTFSPELAVRLINGT